jgi:hypothetical protein
MADVCRRVSASQIEASVQEAVVLQGCEVGVTSTALCAGKAQAEWIIVQRRLIEETKKAKKAQEKKDWYNLVGH